MRIRSLGLGDEDFQTILSALDYTAEDYSERADFEDKHTADDATEEDREEQREYEVAADRYGDLAARLRRMDEPEVRNLDLTERDQADEVIGR